jgi:hypothetical protein
MFSRLLLRVSADSPQGRRPNQDILHYSIWCILLYTYASRHKSAGGTYQRGIQRCLHSQIGRNTEVYTNNMVIKTREEEGQLRKLKMKLNHEKCTFSVPSRKLLGYMVSRHGIDPNPEKVSAITKMKLPESLHDV